MSCCGTRYYCTAAGPVAVDPDADGWYAVPEGGTSGWYKTYEEAVAVCPEPPVGVSCDECETEWEFPGDGFWLDFVNQIGADWQWPNSVWVPYQGFASGVLSCASGSEAGYGAGYGVNGVALDEAGSYLGLLGIQACWLCPAVGTKYVRVSVWAGVNLNSFTGGSTVDAAWTLVNPMPTDTLATVYQDVPCGDQFTQDQYLGTLVWAAGSGNQADVYIRR